MRMCVNSPFISRKTTISWAAAGMTEKKHQNWIHALEQSLQDNRGYRDWLRQALIEGTRFEVRASIFGIPQRVKQLNIHDALSQIIDEITEYLFPKERGRSTRQTKDRHFWKVEAEKFTRSEEKVEIEIQELKEERVKQIHPRLYAH